jgi:SAM-dependent methyltransferase
MERLFYQDRWQGIWLCELPGATRSHVAGRECYRTFYESLLSRHAELASDWIAQKQNIGRWLATVLLKPLGAPETLRVLSVGAGLGVMEGWLWDQGYRVDVLECEEHSLLSLKQRHPELARIMGDARCIPCRSGIYDLVYMSAVDYCFDRIQYGGVLREAQRLLKPGGRVACICLSNLSLKGLIKGAAKSFLNGVVMQSAERERKVLWGYQRTVGEHVSAGRKAGLACESVSLFDRDFTLRHVRRSASARLGWPTARDYAVAVVFTKAQA